MKMAMIAPESITDIQSTNSVSLLHLQAIGAACGAPPGEVSSQDISLAAQTRADRYFVPPPAMDILLKLSEVRNSAPLPEIRPRHGLRIPPESECLLGPNYQLKGEASQPLLQVEAIDSNAVEDRKYDKEDGTRRDHKITITAPSEDWKPGPDRPSEPWPSQL